MATPSINSSGVLRATTSDTVEFNPGTRTVDYILLGVAAFRCSTPGAATLSTPTGWTKLLETVQGSTIVAYYTKKWETSEPVTSVTCTGGGTIDVGFSNVVAYTATTATTRWWDDFQIASGTHAGGPSTAYDVTLPGVTLRTETDIRLASLIVTGDNIAAWTTAPPAPWTSHNINGSSTGSDQGRAHLHAAPGTKFFSASTGTLTTTADAGTIDWIALTIALSGSEVIEASGDVTGTLAATESATDAVSVAGSVEVSGSGDATEAGSDTASLSGAVEVPGSLAVAETGSDTASLTGSVEVAGSQAATETGSDSASFTGSVAPEGISGSLAATEEGQDTASLTGTVEGGEVVAPPATGGGAFGGAPLHSVTTRREKRKPVETKRKQPERRPQEPKPSPLERATVQTFGPVVDTSAISAALDTLAAQMSEYEAMLDEEDEFLLLAS